MSPDDSTTGGPDSELLRIKRRTFVAGSVAVVGAVAAFGLLDGCDSPSTPDTATVVRLRINGEPREVTVDNRTSLLDLLREQVGLTGTKKGCDQGACVHRAGQRAAGGVLPHAGGAADGAEITTIEGRERNGRLHPLQQTFIDEDGFQCGYCATGQIIYGIGCIREGHAGSPEEIREWMSGNICRCGAYTNIHRHRPCRTAGVACSTMIRFRFGRVTDESAALDGDMQAIAQQSGAFTANVDHAQ